MIDLTQFPRLETVGFEPTSDPSPDYNCIAWALGVDDIWIDWAPDYAWPGNGPRSVALESLVEAFQSAGFERCGPSDLDTPGFDVVAIYGEDGEWDHATRRLPDGRWTSKLGVGDDIAHNTADALEGPAYGKVEVFMRRPT